MATAFSRSVGAIDSDGFRGSLWSLAITLVLLAAWLAWFFLARVEVTAPREVGAIVAVGDSITDGSRSTANTNNRWHA